MKFSLILGVGIAIGATGCGTEVTTTGAGGGGGASSTTDTTSAGGAGGAATTSTGTTTSTGSGGEADECATAADCPPDGACVDLEPGGRKVCQFPVVEATACNAQGLDACCTTADCKGVGEKCLETPLTSVCAGVQQQPHNECAVDGCTTNADCNTDEICVPAGALGAKVAFCLRAACHGTICGQESITDCAVLRDPCCGAPVGLYCVGECLTNADCPDGYCGLDPSSQRSVCFPGVAPCPA